MADVFKVPQTFVTRMRRYFHQPNSSGGVTLILIAFIISYIIIARLDADKPHLRQQATSLTLSTVSAMRSHEIIHGDPALNLIKERVLVDNIRYMPINNSNGVFSDSFTKTTGVMVMSENEQILNSDLEHREDDIEKDWGHFLNRPENNDRNGSKSSIDFPHLSFQSISTKSPVNRLKTYTGNVRNVLPTNVNIYDAFSENNIIKKSVAKNRCILLKMLHGDSPICIHDPDLDELISASIADTGTWEPNYLYVAGSVLQLNPDIVFLDLGCNIGVYTILAAKLGHVVVAVDPNRKNLRLLTKSLALGRLKDKVTLLWNAVSDVHENVTVNEIVGNVGGAFVDSVKKGEEALEVVSTLTLDDLIALLRNKPVFIKMDIETYELKALKGGSRFFDEVDVKYLLMEWIAHREGSTGEEIIKLMTKRNIYPHVNAHHNTKLDVEHHKTWPDNVLWIQY